MFYVFVIFFAVIIIGMMTSTRRSRVSGEFVNEPAPSLEKLPLLPFIIFAGTGLVLSLVVHVLGFFGVVLPIKDAVFALHMGIFVIWIPVVALNQGRSRNDFFNQGPKWVDERSPSFLFMRWRVSFTSLPPPPRKRKGVLQENQRHPASCEVSPVTGFCSIASAWQPFGIHDLNDERFLRCARR